MNREGRVSILGRGLAVWLALLSLVVTTGAWALDTIDKPRLKFRAKGPVCSCISSTGDKEIQAALEARFSQKEDATPPPGEVRHVRRDEQKESGE